ncbi:MAG: flippase-like domain-containing protein [Deltaproteobacteria bacterium]|nr:flippase-like domain-containing protein [Deltaproteobacteria bacterium]
MGKKHLFLFASLVLSGVLLFLIFSQNSLSQWHRLISRIRVELLLLFVVLYAIGLLIRTWRYQLLIRGSQTERVPSFGQLALVTAVRNMLVDLLPARSGSLSYLVIMNRVFAVDFSACLSSFTYAVLFDLLTLGPLLAVVLFIDTWKGAAVHPVLWGAGMIITLAGFSAIAFLEPLFRGISQWVEGLTGSFQKKHPWTKTLARHLTETSRSFLALRRARLFWPLLGLSLVLRTIKYSLLYLLLYAVVEAIRDAPLALPFLKVLFGIMASEVAASLPISGIAGFGLYEGILGGTLTGQGITASEGIFISFAMHLLSQVFEYSLGLTALGVILIIWLRGGKRSGIY